MSTNNISHGWTSAATPDSSDVTPTNFNDHAVTGDTAWSSHKITGLADPTSAQDAATKAYVDAHGASPPVSAAALITAYSLFR